MTDKPAAVLPVTIRNHAASQKDARITPTEFGELLLRGREQKNRSLQEIADTTKISIHQLRSLERGDLRRLPGGIYRRAIVRQYAAAVGLSVEDTLRDLASVGGEVDRDIRIVEAIVAPGGDAVSSPFSTTLWSRAAALVVLGAVAALATAWYRAGTTGPADVPVTTTSAPTPGADAPAVALVAATQGVRADAGDIEVATAPAVVHNEPESGNLADADATEGELRITSEPPGAQITVNGIGWGVTPVTIRYMPFGKKVIRATKLGYLSAQRGFDFVPDRRGRAVRIRLSPETR